MTRFVARRIAIGFFLFWAVSIVAFGVTRVIPGDSIDALTAEDTTGNTGVVMTKAMREQFERLYGLDKPLHIQYATWLTRLLRGDLGLSQRTSFPISKDMARRLGPTIELTLASMAIALVIAIPFGLVTAVKRDTPIDFFGTIFSLIGVSIPNFVLGTLLVLAFAIWLPIQIQTGYVAFGDNQVEHLKRLLLPAITLGTSAAAILARLTRSSLLEVLDQDYVRTARAKGMRQRIVLIRHALRNSLIPVLTVAGLQVGSLLGGAVIVESIFSWPGLGTYLISAVHARDYPIIQTMILFYTGLFIGVNLLVDLLYGYIDPRIRYE